ncbi:MAG: hypothetical protein D6B28_00200 [Gammaproteobacteria bacterium]|nr:MAG: hypothetical protein D6B28_00200 [Gammaproteobacteria bacterium]
MNAKRFQYNLKAVQRRNEWEKNSARQDVSEAKKVLEDKKDQEQKLSEKVSDIENELRMMTEGNMDLDPGRLTMTMQYMSSKRHDLSEGKKETLKALEEYDEKFDTYVEADKNVRVIEKHKQRELKKFLQEDNREIYKESDDLWIGRKGE